jgi:transcriptional regulator with XRE-family HTH domain
MQAIAVDPKLVGRRIREIRVALGIGVTKLAAAARINRSTITRIESGRRVAHPETLERIAIVLDVPVSRFTASGQPRTRVAKKKIGPETPLEIPAAVARLLCSGRLGRVTDTELVQLVRNARDPVFAGDSSLLELELLFRRACAAMHDRGRKEAFDHAFERIRRSLEER